MCKILGLSSSTFESKQTKTKDSDGAPDMGHLTHENIEVPKDFLRQLLCQSCFLFVHFCGPTAAGLPPPWCDTALANLFVALLVVTLKDLCSAFVLPDFSVKLGLPLASRSRAPRTLFCSSSYLLGCSFSISVPTFSSRSVFP